jgi:hypothetical protein
MEDKETESRPLTLKKQTWDSLDQIAKKYGYLTTQEVVREFITKILKSENQQ